MTASRKNALSCPNCECSLVVFTSYPLSKELRRYYAACRQCGNAYTCLVYLKGFIRKGVDITPPDEKLQPDLCKQREKFLSVLNKGLKVPSQEPEAPAMTFKNQ